MAQRTQTVPTSQSQQTYSNEASGITFSYPLNYALSESDVGSGKAQHHNVILVDKSATKSVKDGEGPPAITLDIYLNSEDIELKDWLQRHPESNYATALSGTYATTTVSGAEAAAYSWDGLYQGLSVAVVHRASVLLFSATFITPEDATRKDLAGVISSLQLK